MISKTFLIRTLVLFSIICTCFASSQSYAAKKKNDIFERFKKDMPKLELLSNQDFVKATRPVRKKPYGEEVLAYTVRVPKNWTEKDDRSSSNFMLSEKLFLNLNTFYGKPRPSGRVRLEIQALNLDTNITAEQWYIKYILEGGYATEGFVIHNEKSVEALMVMMEGDTAYYLRERIMLNGRKIIMAKLWVPVADMNEFAPMQQQVLDSFKLSYEKERPAEDMLMYRFLDIAELYYPKGWKVRANAIRNVERMDATVVNVREVTSSYDGTVSSSTEAKMDVTVLAATARNSLTDEVKSYKKKTELEGMLIGDKLEEDFEFKYDENMDFAITEVYQGIDSANNLSEYEFWFTVMVGGNYYYFLMLLTPSRNERFSLWAENTQSYKQIVKDFTPMAGAFLERD